MNKSRLKTDLACGLILATTLFTSYAFFRESSKGLYNLKSGQEEIANHASYIQTMKQLDEEFNMEDFE